MKAGTGAHDEILPCRINAAFRIRAERRIYAAAGPDVRRFRSCALALSLLLLQPLVIRAAENPQTPATAGWAEVDITPPLGIGLGGRGGPGTLASKILDPLVAQVLYL